ncbi:UvrD-helicase domain-containing protein [Winogradskyella sp.]|jgi:DNA helicase-2/ATP-dependent DNA helicase PcrA|uniref:UvrD-helicase domain-containing protein n=1 Tax=Winogradskyella sp. TaxID=1883156 RepID=UPI0025F314FE|nr:UvrD-helicase domain-containing protein [Winogradskyella sp.]MCT4629607.1 AAA family ATPase [Winogradskyella sp.]
MASEIDSITKLVKGKSNFLLSGGAGSGKTHTLIALLNQVYKEKPHANIACITFTNIAADEIKERANHENLYVSTIHDFLWFNIGNYQINLVEAFFDLYKEKVVRSDDITKIEYREYKSFKKGVISHDEVISLSKHLFEKYPLLNKILDDRYDLILVDEYQDTFEEVLDILLKSSDKLTKNTIVGLFGDSMQSIFEKGIGDLSDYLGIKEETGVKISLPVEVQKIVNRRNPQSVIQLANKIRLDGLEQKAEKNSNAPNNEENGNIKEGKILFLYSGSNSKKIEDVKSLSFFDNWDFKNYEETKELYLSHSLIAKQADFQSLMDIYSKDKIVGSSSYLKRIKDYIKKYEIIENYDEYTFGQVIESLIKGIDNQLSYEKAIGKLLKIKDEENLTFLKAANLLNKEYPKIKEVLPTESLFNFINENNNIFEKALKSSFENIKRIYLDRSKLIGKKKSSNEESNRRSDERDILIRHLLKIQEILFLFNQERFYELKDLVDFKILFARNKIELKGKLIELNSIKDSNIEDVIDKADELGICFMSDKLEEFIQKNEYLFERVKKVKFSEIENLYNYVEGYTIYSTQHGVKGAEFTNVLISLDPSGDKKLSYKYLFEDTIGKVEIVKRTQKLFYVSCTRAMENLIVFYNEAYSKEAINKASNWFGKANIIDIDTL